MKEGSSVKDGRKEEEASERRKEALWKTEGRKRKPVKEGSPVEDGREEEEASERGKLCGRRKGGRGRQ